MGKKLKQKLLAEELSKETYTQTLQRHAKNKKKKPEKRPDFKSYSPNSRLFKYELEKFLLQEFPCPTDMYDRIVNNSIRKPESWSPRSHDKDKLKIEFINHLFVRYPVPRFMYRCWTVATEFGYRNLFLSWAQGKSVYKNCLSQYLTKAETHNFLTKSSNDLTIKQNIFRAKMDVAGLHPHMKTILLNDEVAIRSFSLKEKIISEIIDFFSRNPVDAHTFRNIYDFINSTPNFSLKGRTVKSLIDLSNKWHEEVFLKNNSDMKAEWVGIGLDTFFIEREVTEKNLSYQETWKFQELRSSEELFREGRQMHNCVSNYVYYCVREYSSIFHVSSYSAYKGHTKRLTVQINNSTGNLIQVYGPCNKIPTKLEMEMAVKLSIRVKSLLKEKMI